MKITLKVSIYSDLFGNNNEINLILDNMKYDKQNK